ncbi:MAG: recombination-associated protein RdgC [Desulfobacteraceae bacterium]|nr:recombination-associated protein RdgC [Desulfobacteraceae bacterium]
MGLLSSTVSITRYKVEGDIEAPVLETITNALKSNIISDLDEDAYDKIVGWTSLENPFNPDFEGSSFVIGTYLVFSLRIDKKTIPQKIVKKHVNIQVAKKLSETGRDYLSKNEKQLIKESVIDKLSRQIPATPNIYDIVWNQEESVLWFFSNQKAANEELEAMFSKSFKVSLIRLFPYTIADLTAGLSEADRDILSKLSPTKFTE